MDVFYQDFSVVEQYLYFPFCRSRPSRPRHGNCQRYRWIWMSPKMHPKQHLQIVQYPSAKNQYSTENMWDEQPNASTEIKTLQEEDWIKLPWICWGQFNLYFELGSPLLFLLKSGNNASSKRVSSRIPLGIEFTSSKHWWLVIVVQFLFINWVEAAKMFGFDISACTIAK